jgi:hypothetical protein
MKISRVIELMTIIINTVYRKIEIYLQFLTRNTSAIKQSLGMDERLHQVECLFYYHQLVLKCMVPKCPENFRNSIGLSKNFLGIWIGTGDSTSWPLRFLVLTHYLYIWKYVKWKVVVCVNIDDKNHQKQRIRGSAETVNSSQTLCLL